MCSTIGNNNVAEFEKLIRKLSINQVCDLPNFIDIEGYTLIHHCVICDTLEILQILFAVYRQNMEKQISNQYIIDGNQTKFEQKMASINTKIKNWIEKGSKQPPPLFFCCLNFLNDQIFTFLA